jgi:hypothetical protein
MYATCIDLVSGYWLDSALEALERTGGDAGRVEPPQPSGRRVGSFDSGPSLVLVQSIACKYDIRP